MPKTRADELFDVVDSEDRILRQEKRAVVHRDGLFLKESSKFFVLSILANKFFS